MLFDVIAYHSVRNLPRVRKQVTRSNACIDLFRAWFSGKLNSSFFASSWEMADTYEFDAFPMLAEVGK